MKKAEFLSAVVATTVKNETPLSKKDIEIALGAILETITETLKKDDTVSFIGFGAFSTAIRAPRVAKVPITGKIVKLPETRVAKFKVGKNLKDALNNK